MISIIVPIYNAEKYLNRCIDSLLQQTYSNIEILLIDDGSTDHSLAICRKYSDNRIRVISKQNEGVSATRNRGIELAKGQYIMFCDADDFVQKEWCEWHLRGIEEYPDAFICSDLNKSIIPPPKLEYSLSKSNYFDLFLKNISGNPVNKIFRKSVLDINNIRFERNIPVGEDVKFTICYLKYCNDGCYLLDAKLYTYYTNEDSAVHRYHQDWMYYHLQSFYCRVPHIEQKYLSDYCDHWLATFIPMFGNIWDERCKMNWFKKMKYNQNLMVSKEFQFCLRNATGKNESAKVIALLKTKCYPVFHMVTNL